MIDSMRDTRTGLISFPDNDSDGRFLSWRSVRLISGVMRGNSWLSVPWLQGTIPGIIPGEKFHASARFNDSRTPISQQYIRILICFLSNAVIYDDLKKKVYRFLQN